MFRKRKWWHYILIIIILVIARYYISMEKQEGDRVSEAAEQATVSQVSVCTMDGKSLPKQDGTSLFIVPTDMEKIYICGSLQISTPYPIAIDLYKSGTDSFFYATQSPNFLQGSFVIEVISKGRLEPGEYRSDLFVVREKPAASVRFLIKR